MKFNDKCGYQLVEASIMMPLIILVSVSIVFLIVFFYECLNRQCLMHEELIAAENQSKELHKTLEDVYVQEGHIKGIRDMLLQREISGKIYLINESMAVRIGEIGYDFQK